MKITNKLPQSKNKRSLLVVSGAFAGVYFLASEGVIVELSRIKEDQQHYSDREGFFQRSGGGEIFGSRSVYEENKIEREKRFIKKISEEATRLEKEIGYEEVYLFGPGYMLGQIASGLPQNVRNKIVKSFDGNYIHEHPFLLLLKIKKDRDSIFGKKVPVREEARKILKKFEVIHK